MHVLRRAVHGWSTGRVLSLANRFQSLFITFKYLVAEEILLLSSGVRKFRLARRSSAARYRSICITFSIANQAENGKGRLSLHAY